MVLSTVHGSSYDAGVLSASAFTEQGRIGQTRCVKA